MQLIGRRQIVSSPRAHDAADLFADPLSRRVAASLCLLVPSLFFFILHFIHLTADFPNFSRWIDWSKFTDEGWYGDAAIRHFLLGHWYVPGDFNPAVALPVWPLLEALLFQFTGVSLVGARALTVCIFGGILMSSWLLVARSTQRGSGTSIAAGVAVLMLATNPFCFVFTRLAILEPLLILLTLLALLAAQRVRPAPKAGWLPLLRANTLPLLMLAVLLPLMVLTKTTGLFLVPAIAWMLFAALGYKLRLLLAAGLPAALLGLLLWLAYYLFFVRPHYLLDYNYLFSANAYTKISAANYRSVLLSTLTDCAWFGRPLMVAAFASAVVAGFSVRRLRGCPLVPALLLWAAGYAAFLAYHNNLQPRYYLVVAIPLTLLVPVTFRELVLPRVSGRVPGRVALVLAAAALAGIVLPDAWETLAIVRHPEYSFVSMARQVQEFIARDKRQDPAHSDLVLSISGSDLSLITGLHSICDDFGTLELVDRVNLYRPGWYAAWNLIEDDKMDALTPGFHVRRVATFPAMDDPDRNLMVLYRLEPAQEVPQPGIVLSPRKRRARPGQTPSRAQASH
jgi:4-amino-4-deoxy-L-arabinose transferase-like glycosyltransferase